MSKLRSGTFVNLAGMLKVKRNFTRIKVKTALRRMNDLPQSKALMIIYINTCKLATEFVSLGNLISRKLNLKLGQFWNLTLFEELLSDYHDKGIITFCKFKSFWKLWQHKVSW